MINNELPIFRHWWKLLLPTLERRPSALMLHGPAGIGKTSFGHEIAAALFCEHPLAEDGSACGECRACGWMRTAQHPDFRWIRSDAEAAEDAELSQDPGLQESSSAEEGSGSEKKKSQEIRIEQIRGLAAFANIGSHRGGIRIALISPANRMNVAAANALLKTLEEPAEQLMFILVADGLRGIPATILSRCRRLDLSIDPKLLSKIQTEQSESAEWLLPLLSAGQVDPLKWAEKAGKTPPGDTIDLLIRWMADAARVRYGLPPRAFPEHAAALEQHALRIRSPQQWSQTIAELQRARAVAEHPLNPRLFFESIFDRLHRSLV